MEQQVRNIEVYQNKAEVGLAQEKAQSTIRRVAAYCRVSTLLEEQEESYDTQCAYYRRLIDGDPALTLVGVYGDQGISGLSMEKRAEFQRLMKDCMDGKIDVVMTKSVSRFARNLGDCIRCVRMLRERGIPILFEREGLNTMDPSCEVMLSVLATLAQEEVNSLSQNIKWAHERRNNMGDPVTRAPYGYRKLPREKGQSQKWVIEPNEARRVKRAFGIALNGGTYCDIVTMFNEMEDAERTGTIWTQPRIRCLLLSEAYIGDVLTNKTYKTDLLSKRVVRNRGERPQYYIEAHHEAIIDRATFEAVGEKIRAGALHSGKLAQGRRRNG